MSETNTKYKVYFDRGEIGRLCNVAVKWPDNYTNEEKVWLIQDDKGYYLEVDPSNPPKSFPVPVSADGVEKEASFLYPQLKYNEVAESVIEDTFENSFKDIEIKYDFLGWYQDSPVNGPELSTRSTPAHWGFFQSIKSDTTLVAKWGWSPKNKDPIYIYPIDLASWVNDSSTRPLIKKATLGCWYEESVPTSVSSSLENLNVKHSALYIAATEHNVAKYIALKDSLFGDLPIKVTLETEYYHDDETIRRGGEIRLGHMGYWKGNYSYRDDWDDELGVNVSSIDTKDKKGSHSVDTTFWSWIEGDIFYADKSKGEVVKHLQVTNTIYGAGAVRLKYLKIIPITATNSKDNNYQIAITNEKPYTVTFKAGSSIIAEFKNQRCIPITPWWPKADSTGHENDSFIGFSVEGFEDFAKDNYLNFPTGSTNYYSLSKDITLNAKWVASSNALQINFYLYNDTDPTLSLKHDQLEEIPTTNTTDSTVLNFLNDILIKNTDMIKESIPLSKLAYKEDNSAYMFKDWELSEITSSNKDTPVIYKLVAKYEKTAGYTQQYDIANISTFFSVYNYNKFLEPYYFGEGIPETDYYKVVDYPIGEDNNNNTSDIKYQRYNNTDSYAVKQDLEGFSINKNKIFGIRKGTYPKLGESQKLWAKSMDKSSTENAHKLIVSYKDKKIDQIVIDPTSDDLTGGENVIALLENKFVPSRLGFLLVGGGGGGGGCTFYEDGCSGSGGPDTGDVTIPGTGGGGGAIATGVLHLDYPQLYFSTLPEDEESCVNVNNEFAILDDDDDIITNQNKLNDLEVSKLIFYFKGGKGGKGNGGLNNRGGKGDSSTTGNDGQSSKVSARFALVDKNNNKYLTEEISILTVKGGSGGKKGHYNDATVSGGAGGSSFNKNSIDCSILTPIDSISGGTGAGLTISDESGSASTIKAYTASLCLSECSITPNKYIEKIEHPEIKVGGSASRSNWTASVYGGYSYGKGSCEETAATYGGGGCSLKTKTGNGEDNFESRKDAAEPTDGANGYLAFYY